MVIKTFFMNVKMWMGRLYGQQVEAAIPWWKETLKNKGPDFDTPDPNEGEFMSAAGYFGLLQEELPKVPYNVQEGELKDLYKEIGQIDNLPEWNHAWGVVSFQCELENNLNDTHEAVLNHITKEHADLFHQYQVAWISEYLGVTYSFGLLAIHQSNEGTGNDMSMQSS